jgi:hypothetical protein
MKDRGKFNCRIVIGGSVAWSSRITGRVTEAAHYVTLDGHEGRVA